MKRRSASVTAVANPGLWRLPTELAAADDELLREVDAALRDGARRAGDDLVCRRGCTSCCLGPFDINALDASRLARALAALERRDPEAAAAVRERATAQWRAMAPSFPGDALTGIFSPDEEARERFLAAFPAAPCPALDGASGGCLLYAARPLSCRTYGLPIRLGAATLPACPLNFARAERRDVDAATVAPDPADREGELLLRAGALGLAGETIVAAVLAGGTR